MGEGLDTVPGRRARSHGRAHPPRAVVVAAPRGL